MARDDCTSSLRLALAHDAQPMAALSRDLIEQGLPWRYTPRRMAALIADPDTLAVVAGQGSALQGLAVMSFGDEQAHLMLLCVQQALQGRGIGRRLVDWLLKSAQVAGMAAVELELRADNHRALAFYRRLAFAQVQQLPGYYRADLDALRLQRVLRATSPLR